MDEEELNAYEKLTAFCRGASKDIFVLIADKFLPLPFAQIVSNGFREIETLRARKALEAIKKKTETINPDTQFIVTEEFHDIFALTLNKMLQTRSQEKIELFADIISNEMSTERRKDYSSEFKELFVRIIADLNLMELDTLYDFHKGKYRELTRTEAYSTGQEKNAALDSLIAKGIFIEAAYTSRVKLSVLGGLLMNYITSFLHTN